MTMTRAEWLEARTKGISGTDIAAIAGVSRWKNVLDVWYEKRGLREPDEESDAMRWGTLQEPIIADYFADKHGVTLTEPGLMVHRDIPYVIGTPDRLINGKDEGLEIKTASSRKYGEWGDIGTDDIPEEYLLQCQWYMALVGYPTWHVAVKIDSADYREYTVKRNDRLISRLLEIASEFWEKNVIGGDTPIVQDKARGVPSKILAQIKEQDTMISFETEEQLEAARGYFAADAEMKAAEARKKLYRAQLESYIGGNMGIEGGGYKITWKHDKPSIVTDWHGVFDDLAEVLGVDVHSADIQRLISNRTAEKKKDRVFRPREVKNNG